MDRIKPFEDLGDFIPGKPAKPVQTAAIEQIAKDNGFPSRQAMAAPVASPPPQRRRYTTGRNQQINVKAAPETIARLYRLADERRLVLGELLEEALLALERTSSSGSGAAG